MGLGTEAMMKHIGELIIGDVIVNSEGSHIITDITLPDEGVRIYTDTCPDGRLYRDVPVLGISAKFDIETPIGEIGGE